MISFGSVCESISATPSKLEKVERLAQYLGTLDDADLQPATLFLTGNAFAQREQKSLSLGGSTIIAAAKHVWGFGETELAVAYRAQGDLGAALAKFVCPPNDLGLFAQTLSPASLKALFEEIATANGKAAGKRRLSLCERILASCTEWIEAKYIVKIMTGDLRIGLKAALVIDGIASAFALPAQEVRRAAMAAGDIGGVAVAARARTLAGLQVAYGVPLSFMLASPLQFGASYAELSAAAWTVEDKFDGIRAQAHKYGELVRLFSRTSSDISHSYPEVIDALKALPGEFILDGELIAQRDGRVLPFRTLQARLQRKSVSEELLEQVPVAFICFDILAVDREVLLDEPLPKRRERLANLLAVNGPHLSAASWSALEPGVNVELLHERFEQARRRGHEGLLIKRRDSPYDPGRRGRWWLKLKRELSTLDVVVVAVEWGHGKRAKVLSDYTFAVRARNGKLLTIGKAYSGLTDTEIAALTGWFLEHETGRQGHLIIVDPKIVLEIAFDIIQPSKLHESGYALRFPRIVRMRDDKPIEEIDTIESVEQIYSDMLKRESPGC